MRKLVLLAWLATAWPVATFWVTEGRADDFDPSGRTRKRPGGKPPTAKPPTAKPPTAKPPTAGPGKPPAVPSRPPVDPAEGTKAGGQDPEALIRRYTAIVLSQPGAPFPLSRLAQLYRERDGNLKGLISDFEGRARVTDGSAWPAKMALAGILKQDGQVDAAIAELESAIADKPKESAPHLALAALSADRGDRAKARGHYETALGLITEPQQLEQITRTLMLLELDLGELASAKVRHDALVKRSNGSLFVKAELGRELLARQKFDLAEAEFRELVKASAGDNRAMAPALRDLGQALAKQKKMVEAVETLKKALDAAAGSAGVRAEIHAVMADAFRAEGRLAELIAILEKEPGEDWNRTRSLASLYEETGNVEQALATYRKAIRLNSGHLETRLRIVALLQTAGSLDEAIKEYEALIRAAPHNTEYVFQFCEVLLQRGERDKAQKALKELEGRTQEPDALAAISDFYERMGEPEKALAMLQKSANVVGADPSFLVDLGDRYYQAGDKTKAEATWAKIATLGGSRAHHQATLGQVYLDHDMADKALESLEDAARLEPDNLAFKKALAVALERTAPGSSLTGLRLAQAIEIWEALLVHPKRDPNLAREARTHIVAIWSLQNELPTRVDPLLARFAGPPPDLDAGRLAAEAQRKLGRLGDAEATLRAIVEADKSDEASLLALERILVQEQDLSGAIEVLERLAALNDKAARQYYQRMAQYSAELYRDDDAVRYAAKAVELSPEDAGGHQKLGDMYRKRQEFEKAAQEYRQAIIKNDRLFPVYFDLAEILLSRGEAAEADRLFRRVIRSSGDDELISRAARTSMQIAQTAGTLETLERDLLPLAVGQPQKPVFRRLLVELYGSMVLPLIQESRLGPTKERRALADKALGAIGARGLKPLLDALSDERESQQRISLDVLGYVRNTAAGPTLFNFSMGRAPLELRERALTAAVALRDEAMLPRFEGLLLGGEGAPLPLLRLAALGVSRIEGKAAEGLLVKLQDHEAPLVRAIANLGLGRTGKSQFEAALVANASRSDNGPKARAAAITALGYLALHGPSGPRPEATALCLAGLRSKNEDEARASLTALARLYSVAPSAPTSDQLSDFRQHLAETILAGKPSLAREAIAAASILTGGRRTKTDQVRSGADDSDDDLGLGPGPIDPDASARVLAELAPRLGEVAENRIATDSAFADAFATDLGIGHVLSPFAGAGLLPGTKSYEVALEATRKIREATVPAFANLLDHPQANLRVKAAQVLRMSSSERAETALIEALSRGDADVKKVALGGAPRARGARFVSAAEARAAGDADWTVRAKAAEFLGGGVGDAERAEALSVLTTLAENDAFASVREAAIRSLVALDPEGAELRLSKIATSDPEPHVRGLATELLTKGAP